MNLAADGSVESVTRRPRHPRRLRGAGRIRRASGVPPACSSVERNSGGRRDRAHRAAARPRLLRRAIPSRSSRGCGREAPVARNETLGLWIVSRHADVVTVSRDPGTFCSAKGIMTFEIGSEYATPPTMMHTDPPDHTRYRDAGAARVPAEFHAGARGRHPRPCENIGRPDRARRPDRRRRGAGRAAAAPGHQRPAGRARGGVAAVLPVVRGGHPRGHRLARGGAGRPSAPRWSTYLLAAAADRRAARRGTTSSPSSARPRSTATA